MHIPEDISRLTVKIIPRARKTEYVWQMSDSTYKIRLQAVPEDGKANEELLSFLERETGKSWEIISGLRNSRKELRVSKTIIIDF